MDFRTASVVGLAQAVRSGEVSAGALVEHSLDRIAELNPLLNAFVAVDPDRARTAARKVDEAVAAGSGVGPLAGIPIGVKDLEDAAGFVTSHGSAALADSEPAARDSVLVARLVAAGCVVVGKTNTPELGWKAHTENPAVRAHAQSLEPRPQPGRVLGGQRRGHRQRDGAARNRFRRWRVDPHPLCLLRALGRQAVARTRPSWRPAGA